MYDASREVHHVAYLYILDSSNPLSIYSLQILLHVNPRHLELQPLDQHEFLNLILRLSLAAANSLAPPQHPPTASHGFQVTETVENSRSNGNTSHIKTSAQCNYIALLKLAGI